MRLRRKSRTDPRPYEERMAEAQEALVRSHIELQESTETATYAASLAARLKKELHDNHFAPALAEAIARSIR